ncbi:response regulator transcription factor [Paenibacillus qinlingensis]|uniref:response regulator transcription factor n=1 Tax=Paenibacillus qinlingensis TaxID=1837343 RepID=UPI001564319E|nr:response regulator [Paenibacillus qinlingensis]NQX59680.1 response regulator [Paenibacillus qinlingensis]
MYKVLIVDDEIMIKRSLAKLIAESPYGFEVIGEADDGMEALALCEKLRPDLLITDISMPVMDGLELIREVRRRKWDMDTIIISGYDDFAYAQQALRQDVTDYLLKPLKEDQLYELLASIDGKFKEKYKLATGRSQWVKQSKARSEAVSEQLWGLNEEEALRLMGDMVQKLREEGASNEVARSCTEDLLTMVEVELQHRSGGGMSELSKPFLTGGNDMPMEGWLAQARGCVQALADMVRSSRNWGQRQSIAKAIEFIVQNYANEDISLQKAAEKSGMSLSYFSRCFKDELGLSFTDFVIKLRMEKVKELLKAPGIRTSDAALAVGYEDYPHFAKTFKKYSGLSPNEYKKREISS